MSRHILATRMGFTDGSTVWEIDQFDPKQAEWPQFVVEQLGIDTDASVSIMAEATSTNGDLGRGRCTSYM